MLGGDVAIDDTISELRGFKDPAIESAVVHGATYSRLQETMVRRDRSRWIASIHNVLIDPTLVPKAELSE